MSANQNKIIIAIDGYAACGKSTLAKALAQQLAYLYIDSGAMYRALTLYFLSNKIDWKSPQLVEESLKNIRLTFESIATAPYPIIHLNGKAVEHLIRGSTINEKVSEIAAIASIRTFMVEQQRSMGAQKGVCMDGRDVGTVIFPQAELKIFMTADMPIRIARRFAELSPTNSSIHIEEVQRNLEERDYLDTHRAIAPLRQAPDARLLDTSSLTPSEQLATALSWAKEAIAESV